MSSDITEAGRAVIADLAARYGASEAAVETLARAVARGGGTMAQFDVPEFGGSGQWMAGGMTMVGNMFDHQLQGRVAGVCAELSNAMAAGPFFVERRAQTAPWWPSGLGSPSATGGQNAMRYAYFPDQRRLAVDPGDGGAVRVLDTLDHQIGGFSQQQSGPGDPFVGLTFSSQYGQYAVGSLPPADGGGPTSGQAGGQMSAQASGQPSGQTSGFGGGGPTPPPPPDPAPQPDSAPPSETSWTGASTGAGPAAATPGPAADPNAILDTISRLAALRDAGALSDDEFAAKKAELLARI